VAAHTAVGPFTLADASRVIAHRGLPRLCELDSMTGEQIHASKATGTRYAGDRPGELVHMDVKKPDG